MPKFWELVSISQPEASNNSSYTSTKGCHIFYTIYMHVMMSLPKFERCIRAIVFLKRTAIGIGDNRLGGVAFFLVNDI